MRITFNEVLEQVRGKVRDKGRVTYRALKREFSLEDDYVADIAAELIDAEYVARDEDGKVLVWVGGAGQVEEGLATVAEALRLVDKNDERIYEAELYRLKGELLLQKAGKVETPR